ncbi:alpha/beta hydrolase [Streptomyces sp. HD]|uniref:alpha/beta hydrolase n=1 Tax=Streptomyces sp. HD TaxID=3020892 RepID=UPI00232E379D|nr:alpha/beta hydrolase [Streptomyces sp. HD]MDC0767533.1 alpha/beta hydrolase [Streptomyces sp. HD]
MGRTTGAAGASASETSASEQSGPGEVHEAPTAHGAGEPGKPRRTRRAHRTHRWRRAFLAALITGAVVVPLSGATRPEIPAPAPAPVARVTAATLDEAYAANRANATQASRMAETHGYRERATADRAMADPSRHYLAFDARGHGLATEVFGDLAHADRIAVLVPGSDTSIDTYDRFRDAARALHERLTREAPQGTRTAVVAWLGYETPGTVSTTVATPDRAEQAAPKLREFIRQLRALTAEGTGGPSGSVGPVGSASSAPRISLLCHSYGSVVCGHAASQLDVDDIVLVGSPGTGADTAAALHTPARVWAARGSDDWVGEVPHIKVDLLGTTVGFGTDPVSPTFGARVFAAGDGGHSDYFRPGSTSLANMTRIVLGETPGVTR